MWLIPDPKTGLERIPGPLISAETYCPTPGIRRYYFTITNFFVALKLPEDNR